MVYSREYCYDNLVDCEGDSEFDDYLKCYNCGGIGHEEYYCSSQKTQRCYNCGNEGHFARECMLPTLPNEFRFRPFEDREDRPQEINTENLYTTLQHESIQEVPHVYPSTTTLIDIDTEEFEAIEYNGQLIEDIKHVKKLITVTKTDLPLYNLICNGVQIEALLDSGASSTYVSPRAVTGVPRKRVSCREVETAGGERISITEQVTLQVNAGGLLHHVPAFILDTKFDLILGRDWIKRMKPTPNMRAHIQDSLASCSQYQLADNADRNVHHAPMKPLNIPPVFARWYLDFVGELPITVNKNRWLLVAVDYATNWTICRAIPNATGEAVADFIYSEIVLKFGAPTEILTDRGANFMSSVLSNYLRRIKVNHIRTNAFHPHTNSKAESTNDILMQMIRKYCNGRIHLWDQFVEPSMFAFNVRKHRTTGFSPFFLVYGQEPVLPGDRLRPFMQIPESTQEDSVDISGRVTEVRRLRDTRARAEQKLKQNAIRDKALWDAALKPQTFSVNDHVLMRHENKFSLEFNWKGPYKIVATRQNSDIYQLEDLQGKIYNSWVHTDYLRSVHYDSTEISSDPWFDPSTTARAAERHKLLASNRITLLSENVQDFLV